MKAWLFKYVIPTKENEYRPYAFRFGGFLIALLLVFLVEAFFLFQIFYLIPRTNASVGAFPKLLVDLTNHERLLQQQEALRVDSGLQRVAQLRAEYMAQAGFFGHADSSGRTVWDDVLNAGYRFSAAGESLARNFFDPHDVMRSWMNSPRHKENILTRSFKDIGIGVARSTLQNKEGIVVVQLMAQRPDASAQAQEAAESRSPQLARILGSRTPSTASFQDVLVAAPKKLNAYLFGALAVFVVAILVWSMFREKRFQYPSPLLLVNGILVLLLIAGLFFINMQFRSGEVAALMALVP